ncbi:MAG: peptidoglycan bridge formation glycyltransferase FemA/FemB family protein [Candidatus Kerfeldbacteria bacterium]|nr:peptidoglycan bridge formation glycyltransferase FemA/FemB family protein [Candidatus Kerfeldbacteria bacterium]
MSVFAVRTPSNPAAWDAFVCEQSQPNVFLQSWAWGEFQRAAGKPIIRMEALNGEDVAAAALLVLHTTRLKKSFLLAPRGPIIRSNLPAAALREVWTSFLEYVERVHSTDTMFVKVEPNTAPPQSLELESGTFVHPEHTLLLDLTMDETQQIEKMHQKTRYNIRLAERKGVRVRFSREERDLNLFINMLKATGRRQGIGVFPDSYYQTMLKTLGQTCQLALAEHQGAALAASILVGFGDTLTYVHGASDDRHREFMASHLMQWESIRYAKERGYRYYDFFGVAPPDSVNHKWQGITRFKLGFGGQVHKYAGAYNVVYNRPWYTLYRLAKRVTGR